MFRLVILFQIINVIFQKRVVIKMFFVFLFFGRGEGELGVVSYMCIF